MRKTRGVQKWVGLVVLGTAFWVSGCTPSRNDEAARPEIKLGAPAFSFDYEKVSELLIVRSDSQREEAWSARLKPVAEDPSWEILSAELPTGLKGMTLVDRRADASYVRHLLDTLRTLRPTSLAPKGRAEAFGLSPPQYALRWSAEGREFEISLGVPVPKSSGWYGQVPGERVMVFEGATLRMLEHLNSFERLRHQRWVTQESDEVDEIEFLRQSRPVLYAQREGEGWVNRNRARLGFDVGAVLEQLTHARVRSFLDEKTLSEELSRWIEAHPRYQVVLKDRRGNATHLRLAMRDGKYWGVISSRPDAVFELYPETANLLQKVTAQKPASD